MFEYRPKQPHLTPKFFVRIRRMAARPMMAMNMTEQEKKRCDKLSRVWENHGQVYLLEWQGDARLDGLRFNRVRLFLSNTDEGVLLGDRKTAVGFYERLVTDGGPSKFQQIIVAIYPKKIPRPRYIMPGEVWPD